MNINRILRIFALFPVGDQHLMLMPYGQKKRERNISIDINALRAKEKKNINIRQAKEEKKYKKLLNFQIAL